MLVAGTLVAIARAQQSHSVWDGVYTQDQAKRGAAAYTEQCGRCHGSDLAGGDSTPPLGGADFLSTWNTKTLGDLFDRIRSSMPADQPGTLNRQQTADIVAYLLSANKFPAGNAELPTQGEALRQIQFDAFKQQAPAQ